MYSRKVGRRVMKQYSHTPQRTDNWHSKIKESVNKVFNEIFSSKMSIRRTKTSNITSIIFNIYVYVGRRYI